MPKYTVSLAMVLAVIWLLFSGKWTHPIILPLGAVSIVLTTWLASRMKIVDREGHPLHLLLPAIRYWPWLLLEILKSNLLVARHILAGTQSISPRIERVAASQKTELGQTIYANSITLTPGTVTLEVADGQISFYALTREMAEGVASGEMDRWATRFEGEE